MELPNTLIGWIMLGLLALLTGSIAIGVRAAIFYLSVRVHNDLFDQLKKAVATKVAALEQDPSLGGLASDEKKERAMVYVINLADKFGIKININEASDLIEEAVYMLRHVALPAVGEALG